MISQVARTPIFSTFIIVTNWGINIVTNLGISSNIVTKRGIT